MQPACENAITKHVEALSVLIFVVNHCWSCFGAVYVNIQFIK